MLIHAVVHMPPVATVPLGVVAMVFLVLYWIRLGRPDVPRSRRIIRRSSIAIALVQIPLLFVSLSLVDPVVHPRAYILCWLACLLLVVLIVVVAMADVVNNFRLHAAESTRLLEDTFTGSDQPDE